MVYRRFDIFCKYQIFYIYFLNIWCCFLILFQDRTTELELLNIFWNNISCFLEFQTYNVKMNLSMKYEINLSNCLQFNKFRIFDDRANYVFVFLPMNIWRKITKSCKQKGHQGLSTNCFRCTVQQRLMANYEYIYGSYACCKICCKLMGSRSSSLHSEFVTYWF